MAYFKAPQLTFLFDLELVVEKAHLPGTTPIGTRRIIRVEGGHFDGSDIKGKVVPGGDDWITVREDGTIIQDVRILLETDDKELIMMSYRGIRTGPKEVLERLDRNEEVTVDEYYFRTNPIFETASKKYDWMNKRIFISTGQRLPTGVKYSVYQVD
ncbi:DUF3237 domain-containing protein [Sporosarcina sp. P3]|uniref:DUF3237 domain-containing protein n=1 Tax=Sporosarcina TaxID=1569 RepID=UPI0009DC7C1A|nr:MULTISPECIES: DUF3237 domain-containing protein [Sporosarcina]ARF17123.1 hypothetical protein SporoP17a_07405 [Sporosarcina ureae]PID20273.1 DUF3237 domain-containing protein [Sporosarcina sp. P3]